MQITRKDKKHDIPLISGEEHDALTGWKRLLKVFDNRTGLGKYAKRKYNKRLRRVGKKEIKDIQNP